MRNNSILYGAVLKITREDTLACIESNLLQMKENGLDTAVVWPAFYWWEEKKEGYPFNTGKEILKLAEKHGIKIIMELAGQLPMMEAIPDSLMKDEYYCVDENGHRRLKYNSFGWLNYFHPEVNSLICEKFGEAAKAYKNFSSLAAYDVFNETAFSSYDVYTQKQFRIWLENKYKTIERLNEVWEHSYTEFSQVSFAPWMWMSIMPCVDFSVFRKEAVKIYLENWCNAIRSVDNTHPLIADNIGSMLTNGTWVYERPQDDFALAEVVDDIGISFYPKQVTGCICPAKRWNTFDAFYAASKRKGFYVSEMQAHVQAIFNPTTAVHPYELKLWCHEALASGIKGLIYWMWRPFTKGLQTGGRGLVDYKNRSTPRLEFVSSFAKTIKQTGALMPLRSKVGILFDPRCQDFQTFYTKCYKLDQNIYLNSLGGAYEAFFDAGVCCDIVRLDEINNYRLIILSNQLVIDASTAAALKEYVENGGTVVCDGKTGVVDDNAMLNGLLPGGEFNSNMGHEYIDSDFGEMNFSCRGAVYSGYYGREITRATDGEVIGYFSDGSPAVVLKKAGDGAVITFNTFVWYGYYSKQNNADEICRAIADKMNLYDVTVTEPLKVRVAENGTKTFAFVFNYTDDTVCGHLSGCGVDTDVCVPSNDVIIVTRENSV